MNLARLMNDTKWDEIRLGMCELGELSPKWRTKDAENGYICPWDREWFYHFRNGCYQSIEWLEISCDSPAQVAAVGAVLQRIGVPGEQVGNVFHVLGYAPIGMVVDYLVPSAGRFRPDGVGGPEV